MKIRIKRGKLQTWLELPCSEVEMQEAERRIGIHNPVDTRVIVTDIEDTYKALNALIGGQYDLDHLNLLGRCINDLKKRNLLQYLGAISYTRAKELKDMINLTQNLSNYSIILTGEDPLRAACSYCMDRDGVFHGKDTDKLPEIAKKLMDSIPDRIRAGKGRETPYGIVIENDLEYQMFFNGQNIPPYFDRECIVYCTLCHGEAEECLFLPCHEAEIDKAFHRLGAKEAECTVIVEYHWLDNYTNSRNPDIRELNRLAQEVLEMSGSDTIQHDRMPTLGGMM